jgi:hypothetical protein
MAIGRFQAALFSRTVFLPIKNAVMLAVESVFELHVFLHVEENARTECSPLASCRGVLAEFARILVSARYLLAIPLAFVSQSEPPAGEAAALERLTLWLQR